MAEQKQLDLLKQSVEVWNTWRTRRKKTFIDLTGANLNETNLNGANLHKANLSEAFLIGTDLSEANLSLATLSGATFRGVIVTETNDTKTFYRKTYVSRITTSKFTGTISRHADTWHVINSDANLINTNLRAANLSGVDLSEVNLSRADLQFADLSRTNLSEANLSGANLSEANLSGANLSEANLSGANLSGANLKEANFNGANLKEADFDSTIVGWTDFGNLDLRTVKGLETIQHQGPSTIGTDTLGKSEGNVPEIFLRGTGLSDTFITYVRSLVRSPIQYYTCFISYSSKDQDFVDRLYADLQHHDVLCWYAPEDLKIGEHFPERIEEAICRYDKLIVILSEHSIGSSWVEDEVRAAQDKEERFKREQQLTKTVLFPIKIDTAIDQATVQWAARLRRSRHIGNFIDWKQHDSYQKAFQRLLRDLQQAPTKDEPPHDRTP